MNNILKNGWSWLDGTRLKLIGIVLMLCDHIHQMFGAITTANLTWLNMLGRPVFPMFLFMLSEGMQHTRSRKKYLWLLFAGSVVMTIGSRIVQNYFSIETVNGTVALMNNVFGTLLVTGLYIVFYDIIVAGIKAKSAKKILGGIGLMLLPIIVSLLYLVGEGVPAGVISIFYLLIALIPNILVIEGGPFMVLMGLLFYAFRKRRLAQVAVLVALSVLTFVLNPSGIQRMMVFAAIPMILYNGKKGKGRKWLFYVFYPLHIWILYIIASCVQ